MRNEYFDDLRPYYDDEISAAMYRIADNMYLPSVAPFVFPEKTVEEVKEILRACSTTYEFQSRVMVPLSKQIIKRTITRFSHDGLDNLSRDKEYLFVANHRDIVLDSALLQYILHTSGFRTTEITFGSNLMNPEFVVDIGKSNKMFKVIRGGNAKDFYRNSLHLSEYMHHALHEKKESLWIAQRNGRTKNGIDATDQGIIKMFYMGSPETPAKALAGLNIVPLSISYLWEPCDKLKALELYESAREGKYTKRPGEDLNSILTGITQLKGDVHISIGKPLSTEDLEPLASLPNSRFNKQVALLIDKQILRNYKLTCNNYIAHDIRSQETRHARHYTEAEKDAFMQYYRDILRSDVEDKKMLGDLFLGIYANPTDSRLQ